MKRRTVARILAFTLSASLLLPCAAQAAVEDAAAADLVAEEKQNPENGQDEQTESEFSSETEESPAQPENNSGVPAEEAQQDAFSVPPLQSPAPTADVTAEGQDADAGVSRTEEETETEVRDQEESQAEEKTASGEERTEPEGSWIRSGNRWWYRYQDGSYPRSAWKELEGSWYYFDAEGWMATGWRQISSIWYYLDESGRMLTGWQQIGGSWYYLDENGHMLTGWQQIGGIWYYMNGSGQMLTGWQYLNGAWYYMDGSGHMLTGWAYVNGAWYYMNGSGRMLTGWQQIGGRWYYLDGSGRMLTGWQYLGGRWYYMNGSGQMLTGWQQIGGIWYYMNGSGQMLTGWQQIGGSWYYMDGSGHMLTGWQKIGGTYYYLQPSGAMAADTWIGDWYVDGSGAWIEGKKKTFQEGWMNTNGLWWYQYKDGSYAKSGWKTIGGKEYYFDDAGWMKTGWLKLNGTWYYLNSDGSKAYSQWIGTTGVGGYYIDKYGRMVADGQYSLNYSIYTFDENGKCTGREDRYVTMKDPVNGKNYLLERQVLTDPQVSDDELLAAAVYAEAGNQKMPGMTGVALVMLNRCASSEYPSSVKCMIYQNQQFEVARNGALTRYLKNINSSYLDDAKEAVAAARAIMEDYQKNGTPRTVEGLTMPEGKTDFDYMGFMTPAAFKNAGLDWEATDAFTYMNTTFYTRWIKEKS